MRQRFVNGFRTALACGFALAVGLGVRAGNVSRLGAIAGEHTYYLDSASSQALVKTRLSFSDIFRVRGESVVAERGEAESIAERFGAALVATEYAGDAVSYYYTVDAWGGGVLIDGKRVNLHIAVGENRVVVGTPVIFGGF